MGDELAGKGAGGGGAGQSAFNAEDEIILQESGERRGEVQEMVGGAHFHQLQGLVRGAL